MSSSASQLAAGPGAVPGHRSVLAHLLHAMNQPLTGLQCSLELAVATTRTPAQYIRTLQEGLELTQRIRLLVETIREITDAQHVGDEDVESFALDELVNETAAGLAPVAESRDLRLELECVRPLQVEQNRRRMGELMFRLLESVIALARPGTEIAISCSLEGGQGAVGISWRDGPAQEHSPFSRPELGLLIARAGWEQAGAIWKQESAYGLHSCSIRIAAISGASSNQPLA